MVPNWLIATPDPNVAVGHLCEPFKVEMVIRGYMSGHAAREYKAGKRIALWCGYARRHERETINFQNQSLHQQQKLKWAIMMKIFREKILLIQGIVSEEDYLVLEDYTRKLFNEELKLQHKED